MNNPMIKILMENASTFLERNKIVSLMENERHAVNNNMITNLYKSAIAKAHVDFDKIPDSQGIIEKYVGYESLVETLDILKTIAKDSPSQIKGIEVIDESISNLKAYSNHFHTGFRLNKEFIIMQYNILVYAVIESTSVLIASYVDFVKRPDKNEFEVLKAKDNNGFSSIENLRKFNTAVKKGDFGKVLDTINKSGKESLLGVDDILVPMIIIGTVVTIVPIIRELIFTFYYSRMKISDFLKHQAILLEINKENLALETMPANKRNEIIKKQAEKIKKLHKLSDAIKVNAVMTDKKSGESLKAENKKWTIDDVQSQTASNDSNGFQLL